MDYLELDSIHRIIWALSFVGIIISSILAIHPKHNLVKGIGSFTYFLNVFAYNAALHFGLLSIYQLEVWSGVVRLHGMLLIILIDIEYLIRKK